MSTEQEWSEVNVELEVEMDLIRTYSGFFAFPLETFDGHYCTVRVQKLTQQFLRCSSSFVAWQAAPPAPSCSGCIRVVEEALQKTEREVALPGMLPRSNRLRGTRHMHARIISMQAVSLIVAKGKVEGEYCSGTALRAALSRCPHSRLQLPLIPCVVCGWGRLGSETHGSDRGWIFPRHWIALQI
jgi:hypothetical protein